VTIEFADATAAVRLPEISPVDMTVDSDDPSPPKVKADGTPDRRGHNGVRMYGMATTVKAEFARRIASGERPWHPIEEVHFGAGRFTRCACGFECTGPTDKAMSDAWDAHVDSFRGQYGRSFPVQTIKPEEVDAA
jgi:hypothetical protein